jgi:hypothetical protein
MTQTLAQQLAWENQCYGMTVTELNNMREQARKLFTDDKMLAMSLLSDAQELVALDQKEKARQHINCAKLIIYEHLLVKQMIDIDKMKEEDRAERFQSYMEEDKK